MAQLVNPSAPPRYELLLTSILVLAALYLGREVFIPFFLAALFAFLLTPAVKRLEAWKLPRLPAVLAVVISAVLLVGFPGWIAANQLIDVLNQLPAYKENIHRKFEILRGPKRGGLAKASESVKELSKELSGAAPEPSPSPVEPGKRGGAPPSRQPADRPVVVQVAEPPTTVVQSLRSILGPLLAPTATAGIVLVFVIGMLLKREDLRNRFLSLVGQPQLSLATEAIDDAAQRVSRYLRLQFVVNAMFGMLISLGLYVIGLPNALLWGVLAGAFRFVPYVGAIAGATLPVILALAIFDGWLQPMMCLSLFLVTEPVVGYFVEPALYGTQTGISALAILLAAVFWTALWGPAGLILSTPLTVCLVVIGRHVPHLGFLHTTLSDEAVLSPAAQVYQRFLALDQQEAQSIIDDYLKEHPLIELFDDVLIPALRMAEDDRHKGAIDETRVRFLMQSLEEAIANLADLDSKPFDKDEDIGQPIADGSTGSRAAARSATRIVCIPAQDKADEVTGAMLAQVLDVAGYTTLSLPVARSPEEVVEMLSTHQSEIVCISAMPPFARMKARALVKQLRARFPRLRIILGLWSPTDGEENAKQPRSTPVSVEAVATLAQALARIQPPEPRLEHESPSGSPISASA